jgi:beta-lactamase superfamily II metal-dependent hydrolase
MAATDASPNGLSVPDGQVLIRMYDIGFGDCFLLCIPTVDGLRKVLVDCGSIAKREKSQTEIVKRLIEDVRDENGVPKIDVVIATHRHADHVAGFARHEWSQVEVGEVWMPWTEHPTNPEAQRIREAQASLAAALAAALAVNAEDEDPGEAANDEDSPHDISHYLALNALSNEQAMDTLHNGFSGQSLRRFLPEVDSVDTHLITSTLPGVMVHVLGPSREEDVIRDMDPPEKQSYLRLSATVKDDQGIPEPFGAKWVVDDPPLKLSAGDETTIHELHLRMGQPLAVALDKAVNGTSLMLMFVVGDLYLLFPGDAQWGSWKAALDDPERRRLLGKTHFYKVGHHGSHNATPVEFVEEVLTESGANRRSAMVSVEPRSQWKHIPRKPLLEKLRTRIGAIARSDVTDDQPGFVRQADWYVELLLPIDAG